MPVTEMAAPKAAGAVAFSKSPSAFVVEVGSEAVILDEATQRLHLLNPMAAVVWACIDGSSSLQEICADLADELGAPHGVVLADTIALAALLQSEGLLFDPNGAPPLAAVEADQSDHGPGCTHDDPIPDLRDRFEGVLAEPPNP